MCRNVNESNAELFINNDRINHHIENLEYGQRPSRRWRELRRLFVANHLSALPENGRRDEPSALQQRPEISAPEGCRRQRNAQRRNVRLGNAHKQAWRGVGSLLCANASQPWHGKRDAWANLHQEPEQDSGPGQTAARHRDDQPRKLVADGLRCEGQDL